MEDTANSPYESRLHGGRVSTHVYVGLRGDELVYVGSTENPESRALLRGGRFQVRKITERPVSRGEAHAIEQAIIEHNPGLINRIGAIPRSR